MLPVLLPRRSLVVNMHSVPDEYAQAALGAVLERKVELVEICWEFLLHSLLLSPAPKVY